MIPALATLFDASARRNKKHDDLLAQRETLQAEYLAAIAAGEDVDRIDAKLRKLAQEIDAVQAAIDATASAVDRQKKAAADAELERLEAIAVTALADYVRESTEFTEGLIAGGFEGSVLEKWRQVEDAFAIALRTERQAHNAGSVCKTVSERRITPDHVWSRAFAELLRSLYQRGVSVHKFPDMAARHEAESITVRLARTRDAHPQRSQEILQ